MSTEKMNHGFPFKLLHIRHLTLHSVFALSLKTRQEPNQKAGFFLSKLSIHRQISVHADTKTYINT